MRIGSALFLIGLGAILKFAITVHNTHGFNLNTIGVILMVVGAIGLVAELILMSTRRRTHVVQQAPIATTRTTRTTYSEPQDPDVRY